VSAVAARLLALPFVLLAFALEQVHEFWIKPLIWQQFESGWAATAAWVLSLLATVTIPLCVYLLLTRRAGRRMADWQVDQDGRRFTASTASRRLGAWAVVLGYMAGGLPITERVPGENRVRFADFDYGTPISIAAAVIALVVIVVLVLLGRPDIALDPEAITLRQVWGRRRIPWEHSGTPTLDQFSADRFQVDPAFLAYTVWYYTGYPGCRAEIGTASGLAALRSSFQSVQDGPDQGGPAHSSTS